MADAYSRDVFFHEEQRFRQVWLWAVVTSSVLALTVVTALILLDPATGPALKAFQLVFWVVFACGLPFLFQAMKLQTEVRRDGIHYRFFPIHLSFRTVRFESLDKYYARTYRPIMEYGGWGVRKGWKGGWAYNVSGNLGVQLELTDGKKILLGSRRPEEFVKAIDAALENRDLR